MERRDLKVERREFTKALLCAPFMGGLMGCDPATDHAAAHVERASSALRLDTGQQSGWLGGPGIVDIKECKLVVNCHREVGSATPFNQPASGRLRELWVWSGNYIDGLEFLWQPEDDPNRLVRSPHIGGWGGRTQTPLLLAEDEVIVRVQVKAGRYIDKLAVLTNKYRQMVWGGNGGDPWKDLEVPAGREVHGFYGKAYRYIHQLGLWHYEP